MLLLVTEAIGGPPLAATHADAGGELLMADARGQASGLPNGLVGTACGVHDGASTTSIASGAWGMGVTPVASS